MIEILSRQDRQSSDGHLADPCVQFSSTGLFGVVDKVTDPSALAHRMPPTASARQVGGLIHGGKCPGCAAGGKRGFGRWLVVRSEVSGRQGDHLALARDGLSAEVLPAVYRWRIGGWEPA